MSVISCDLSVHWWLTILFSLCCHTLPVNFNGKMKWASDEWKDFYQLGESFHTHNVPRTWLAGSHSSPSRSWLPCESLVIRDVLITCVGRARVQSQVRGAKNSPLKSRIEYFQKLWKMNSLRENIPFLGWIMWPTINLLHGTAGFQKCTQTKVPNSFENLPK